MNFFLLAAKLLKLITVVNALPYFENTEIAPPMTSNCEYDIIDFTDNTIPKNYDTTFNLKNNFIFSNKKSGNIKLNFIQFIDEDNILINSDQTDKNNDDNLQQLALFNINSKQCNLLYNSKVAIENINFNSASYMLAFVVNDTIHGYNLNSSKKIINKYNLKSPVKIVDMTFNYNGKILIVANKNSVMAYDVNNNTLTGNDPTLLFKDTITERLDDDFCRIKGVVSSLIENIIYVHGSLYYRPLNMRGFNHINNQVVSYAINNNIFTSREMAIGYRNNRDKFLFPAKRNLIVSTNRRHTQNNILYPDIRVYSMLDQGNFYTNLASKILYQKGTKKINDVTIDNNKNIMAIISSDNDITIIQLAMARCNNSDTIFTKDLVDKRNSATANILAFNGDTSKLAMAGNDRLQIYSLNFINLLNIDDLNKCILPTKSDNL
jgi:hypothetical protein